MDNNGIVKRFASTLSAIYKPNYIILNIISALLYYYLFTWLIRSQDYGILLFNVPQAAIILLVITSSILFTIAIYSIRNTIRNSAKFSASSFGTVTALAGGVVGGCGCSTPILFSLTAIGLSSTEVINLNNFFSANTLAVFSVMIILNLLVTTYYINKLSMPSCKIPKRKNKN